MYFFLAFNSKITTMDFRHSMTVSSLKQTNSNQFKKVANTVSKQRRLIESSANSNTLPRLPVVSNYEVKEKLNHSFLNSYLETKSIKKDSKINNLHNVNKAFFKHKEGKHITYLPVFKVNDNYQNNLNKVDINIKGNSFRPMKTYSSKLSLTEKLPFPTNYGYTFLLNKKVAERQKFLMKSIGKNSYDMPQVSNMYNIPKNTENHFEMLPKRISLKSFSTTACGNDKRAKISQTNQPTNSSSKSVTERSSVKDEKSTSSSISTNTKHSKSLNSSQTLVNKNKAVSVEDKEVNEKVSSGDKVYKPVIQVFIKTPKMQNIDNNNSVDYVKKQKPKKRNRDEKMFIVSKSQAQEKQVINDKNKNHQFSDKFNKAGKNENKRQLKRPKSKPNVLKSKLITLESQSSCGQDSLLDQQRHAEKTRIRKLRLGYSGHLNHPTFSSDIFKNEAALEKCVKKKSFIRKGKSLSSAKLDRKKITSLIERISFLEEQKKLRLDIVQMKKPTTANFYNQNNSVNYLRKSDYLKLYNKYLLSSLSKKE